MIKVNLFELESRLDSARQAVLKNINALDDDLSETWAEVRKELRELELLMNEVKPECCVKRYYDGKPIMIKRGEKGYYPFELPMTDAMIARRNLEYGADELDIEAMYTGSMFGWDCDGASDAWLQSHEKARRDRDHLERFADER